MNLKLSLSSLFGGQVTSHDPHTVNAMGAKAAPGTQLHHDGGPIPRFLGHHSVLDYLIAKVRSSAALEDYDCNAKYIREFKLMLNGYLLEENLRLYTNRQHCLNDDIEGNEPMQKMHKEAGNIGRAATQLIRHYEEFGVDACRAGWHHDCTR